MEVPMTSKWTSWWVAVPIVSGAALALGCQNESTSSGSRNTAPGASNQSPSTQSPSTQTSPAKSDDLTKTNIVLVELHAANQQEIGEGKLAADRAQNPDVKKFANDMVTDHTSADQKLTDLAKRLEVELSESPTNPVEIALSKANDARKRTLSGLSGPSFDVAYIAPQVDMHELVLRLIDEGQKAASADAKRLFDELKPTVESHREHAKSLIRGLRFEPTAMGGGPAGGAGSTLERAEPGRSDRATARHDGGTH
jgi:putative membrane protein